jgi:hypothetical protein
MTPRTSAAGHRKEMVIIQFLSRACSHGNIWGLDVSLSASSQSDINLRKCTCIKNFTNLRSGVPRKTNFGNNRSPQTGNIDVWFSVARLTFLNQMSNFLITAFFQSVTINDSTSVTTKTKIDTPWVFVMNQHQDNHIFRETRWQVRSRQHLPASQQCGIGTTRQ